MLSGALRDGKNYKLDERQDSASSDSSSVSTERDYGGAAG